MKDSWRSLVVPLVLLNAVIYLFAHLYFFRQAFQQSSGRGRVEPGFAFDNFETIATDGYYQEIVVKTFLFGAVIVIVSAVLAYPLAYLIARTQRAGTWLLVITVMTAFTSVIVRAIGLRIALGQNGPVNSFLLWTGIVNEPLPLVNTFLGAIIGTVHAVLPFMILFLFPALETISRSLEEASQALGANWLYTFRKVILPLSLPGLISGSLVVFAITLASFSTPALLGGARIPLLSVAIRQQLTTALNAPMAAALGVILVLMVVVVLILTASVSPRLERRHR